MASITVNTEWVTPLQGAIKRRIPAGGSGSLADSVYVDSSGTAQQSDASAEASSQAVGVAVRVETEGNTTFASGDQLEVVTHGPVDLGPDADMTPGSLVFVSETAGDMDQTAPTTSGAYPFAIGRALTARILYVDPQGIAPTANI